MSATMLPVERMPERELRLGWFDWLTRHRPSLYTLLALIYIAAFNGFWRVGVDSALYRGLARSLARGDGYVFAGEHHHHAYPGLPWLLAGLDIVFGQTPVPGLLLMMLMALLTLWLIDRTISLRYPLWVATAVTIGTALNVLFIRQSQQLMTDVPFTLGVITTLYALERLRLLPAGARWNSLALWAGMLVAGLGLAAVMRPTFAVLAGAIVVASAVRTVFGTAGRRWLHAGILGAALLVVLALFLADPRTVGVSPLQGVYEQEFVERVQEFPHTMAGQLHALLSRDLNDAFFSQRLSPVSYAASLLVLLSAALVLRRDLVWGLTIFGLVAITLPLSTVPRYYIMVMPLLFLGWTLLWCRIALRVSPRWQGPFLAVAIGFPMMVNGGRTVGFVLEQRRPDVVRLTRGIDRATTFYADYREGIVPHQQAIARMIAEHATRAQTVIGPNAHVLAYFADRRVIGERTLFIDRELALSKLPNLLAKAQPDLAIFPVSAYDDNDSLMRDLIRRRILVAEREVARVNETQLAEASVRLPPPGVNWRTLHAPGSTTRMSATQKAELIAKRDRKADRAAKLKHAQKMERQATLEKRAKIERREKRERLEKRDRAAKREIIQRRERRERLDRRNAASTMPTTIPVTPPTTLPK